MKLQFATSKLLFTCFLLLFFACSTPKKYVSFNQKNQESFSNKNLQTFLKNNSSPKIVLRVPNVEENVTSKITNEQQIVTQKEKERNDLYYNAIEKELLMAGFSVRDRGLFNEVLKKMQRDTKQNIDYSQIQELTNTDLILEVVKIDPSIEYVTNKYYTIGKRDKKVESTSGVEYKQYGASAEFKIILVSNNEMSGSFKFHYTPCLDGCETSTLKNKVNLNIIPKSKSSVIAPPAYTGVEVDRMEEFIKRCTKDLVKSVKS
jgi:hypothetical protein